MARWTLSAGPSTSAPRAQLTQARSRKMVFKLAEPSELTFTIDGRHDEAYEVLELATDVHALRDDVPLLTTRVVSASDDFTDAAHDTTVQCRDTRALLARRLTLANRSWLGADAATVFTALVGDAQAAPYTSLGITVPALAATGVLVTRDAKIGMPILGELQAAAGGTEGDASLFDWDVSPGWPGGPPGWDGTPGRTAQLWTPARGRDLTGAVDRTAAVILDYTWRNGQPRSTDIAGVRRSFDPSTYANTVTVTGGQYQSTVQVQSATAVQSLERIVRGLTDVAAGNPILTRTVRVDGRGTESLDDDIEDVEITIPTTPVTLSDGRTVWDIGTFAAAVSDADVTTQAAVNARAEQLAEELSKVTPTYDVTLATGKWRGPSHIWLGDKVRLILDSGRLNEDVALRVQAIAVDVDDDGAETITLTVGPTRRDPLAVMLAHARRLTALERAA